MKSLPKFAADGGPIRPLNTCLEPARTLPDAASGLPATGLEPAEDLPATPRNPAGRGPRPAHDLPEPARGVRRGTASTILGWWPYLRPV